MTDSLKSNIQLCKDLYDERLGVGNWALTNYGGGTKVLVKNISLSILYHVIDAPYTIYS